eukprot:2016186-Amphidinium_carterae.1
MSGSPVRANVFVSELCKIDGILNLNGAGFSDMEVVNAIAAVVSRENHVRTLSLRDNRIGDAGAFALSEALKSCSCRLDTLWLDGNRIWDAGACALSEALKSRSCKLEELGLHGNRIGDVGACALSEALQSDSCELERLYLRDNHIGDAGRDALALVLTQCANLAVWTNNGV